MKDYLNAQECNDFMTVRYVTLMTEKMLEEWGARGNLTKEETTFLKYISTYSEKFFQAVGARLDNKEKLKINKRLAKFEFKLVDDYQFQKAMREVQEAMKTAVMPREDFDQFCEEIMDIRCKGCEKHWCDCELYKVFENNIAPEPTGYEKNNCRYAYDPPIRFNHVTNNI